MTKKHSEEHVSSETETRFEKKITHILDDIVEILEGHTIIMAHVGLRLDNMDNKPANEDLVRIVMNGGRRRRSKG